MTTALALYSGGLDSTLACRLIMEQGIRVVAVKFVTPFFGTALLADPQAYRDEVRRRYGIEVMLRDLTEPYLRMLAAPAHGYGKNFNPCVDCKILLMGEALRMLAEFDASFLISGEVLGQRPMSQRRDTLRVIERDSGCDDLLLRPLSARHLPPTRPEREGLVDRDRLLAFRGRNRTPQIELAARFGIEDYESPGGGCVLTDPNLAKRIRGLYEEASLVGKIPTAADIRLLLAGRVLRLPGGAWLVLGRNEPENDRLQTLALPTDWLLNLRDDPGPTAVLRRPATLAARIDAREREEQDLAAAATLVLRYAGKSCRARNRAVVRAETTGRARELATTPLADQVFADWHH
ncbi:MAG TPA: thiamine biosynthesis protein [Desulfurivibrio alkaliphilus]|uniref:Thiamine biosynthesis protein n=1 Tax=Desulfurivibrio alkaliphilus TaxID=427923 RepID=A0A7C2TG43_9BACT|nr:thiamine biosynthesis protein [Desulfurivibrio alkaliphilus]